MHYSFNPITMSITIAITSNRCIIASILRQYPSLPTPMPSRLSHVLQLVSYNNVHHHLHHVHHMHYSFDPLTMSIISITDAITSITCITASILYQLPSTSQSRLSHALQLQSYNNIHHHSHHVFIMHYRFDPITMSITSITITITSITCITASIL